jgi:hypothetical protein
MNRSSMNAVAPPWGELDENVWACFLLHLLPRDLAQVHQPLSYCQDIHLSAQLGGR